MKSFVAIADGGMVPLREAVVWATLATHCAHRRDPVPVPGAGAGAAGAVPPRRVADGRGPNASLSPAPHA